MYIEVLEIRKSSLSLQIGRRSLNVAVCYSNTLARLLDKMKNAVASRLFIYLNLSLQINPLSTNVLGK